MTGKIVGAHLVAGILAVSQQIAAPELQQIQIVLRNLPVAVGIARGGGHQNGVRALFDRHLPLGAIGIHGGGIEIIRRMRDAVALML